MINNMLIGVSFVLANFKLLCKNQTYTEVGRITMNPNYPSLSFTNHWFMVTLFYIYFPFPDTNKCFSVFVYFLKIYNHIAYVAAYEINNCSLILSKSIQLINFLTCIIDIFLRVGLLNKIHSRSTYCIWLCLLNVYWLIDSLFFSLKNVLF